MKLPNFLFIGKRLRQEHARKIWRQMTKEEMLRKGWICNGDCCKTIREALDE